MKPRVKARIEGHREWTMSWDEKGIREEVKGQGGLEPEVTLGVTEERLKGQGSVGIPTEVMESAVMWK